MSFIINPYRFAGDPVPDYIGRWKLDEGSGTNTADDSGNGNDGTLVNSPTWVTGKVGPFAVQMDGIDQYINVPDDAVLDLGTSDFTVAFWANFTDAINEALFTKDNFAGSGNGFYIYTLSSRFRYWNGSSGTSFGPNPLSTSTWYHCACVRSGTTVSFYIDGSDTGTSTTDSRNFSNSSPLRFGNFADNTRFLDGTMDDIRLYDRALSGSEITSLYDLGNP